MAASEYLIDVRGLKKFFPVRQNLFRSTTKSAYVKAVDDISFHIRHGQSLGIAGESGCGKSTTGRMLLRLLAPTAGHFLFNGRDVTHLTDKKQRNEFRKQAQLMFQNPYEALNPRFTIERAIAEPLMIHGKGDRDERRDHVRAALNQVNLRPDDFMDKHPHQMSGGQLQRVVLARALIVEPIFLVADEPVSMLDVSVRAGVLNLMKSITKEMGLTTIYISHDLSLIQYMCENTAIMYLGKIVEWGPTADVLSNPRHPYTKALIDAVPIPDPTSEAVELRIRNHVPNPVDLPAGCRFCDRCFEMVGKCRKEEPPIIKINENHWVACHLISALS